MDEEATSVRQKMINVLSDGQPHTKEELHACLWDNQGRLNNICSHITAIRKMLRPRGEDVVCEYLGHGVRYRQVRLLHPAGDGRR